MRWARLVAAFAYTLRCHLMAVEVVRGDILNLLLGSAEEAERVRTDRNPPAAICNVSKVVIWWLW